MQVQEKNSIGLLDLLAPLVEAWWLIILVPLVSGLGAFLLTAPTISHYQAAGTFDAPSASLAEIVAQTRYDESFTNSDVAISVRETNVPSQSVAVATSPRAGETEGALRLIEERATDPTSLLADEARQTEAQLAANASAIEALRANRENIEQTFQDDPSWEPEGYARAIALLTSEISTLETRQERLEERLSRIPTGAILSIEAETPQRTSSRAIVPFVVVGSLVATILLVLILEAARQALKTDPQSPGAQRIARVFRRRRAGRD